MMRFKLMTITKTIVTFVIDYRASKESNINLSKQADKRITRHMLLPFKWMTIDIPAVD